MDFVNLQRKLFNIEPSNPAEDKAKMIAAVQGNAQQSVEVPQSNVQESVEAYHAPQGSLQMDKDYSMSDFAALAGVKTSNTPIMETITDQDYHPLPNTDNKDLRIEKLEERVAKLESLLERSLTKGEENKKEKIVKGMKKNKDDFKKRYGKDAEAVMYATATKNAKKESFIKDELYRRLAEYEFKSTKK